MGLFALIHVFAGLFMLRKTFNMFFGRTHIVVDERGLTLKRTPSFKKAVIDVRREELDQFYVTHSSKGYSLMLQSRGDTHIELVGKLKSYEHAKHIEDFLETQLEIRNHKVAGEHKTN